MPSFLNDALTTGPVARAQLGVAEVYRSPAVDSIELINTAAPHCRVASRKLNISRSTLVPVESNKAYRNLHLHTSADLLERDLKSSRSTFDFIATVIETDRCM